jgi:endonuclease YncB( thermonuclease family)
MWKRMGCAAAMGFILLIPSVFALTASWEKLENCRFVEGSHSDGDSIEAEVRGKRYIFRLYFVDAIEKNSQSRARRAGQAKYFGIKGAEAEARALQAAYAASDFTRNRLQKPFIVYTRWEKVDPRGNNPSLRAFVRTADGKDLATALVGEGLAVIRSGRRSTADHPEGRTVDETLRDLRQIETRAHLAGRGAWASSPLGTKASVAPARIIPARDTKTLRTLAGHKARVTGRVSRVGSLPDGRITFLNFEGTERGDFVAIVRAGSLAKLKKRFPDGLEKALTGRDVTVEGLVTLYRDAPQIEIESPGQLSVVPAP